MWSLCVQTVCQLKHLQCSIDNYKCCTDNSNVESICSGSRPIETFFYVNRYNVVQIILMWSLCVQIVGQLEHCSMLLHKCIYKCCTDNSNVESMCSGSLPIGTLFYVAT